MTSDDRTFTFVDLAGFTALTEAHGDETAADLADRFVTVVAEELGGSSRLVKTIGDAVLIVADHPEDGLQTGERVLNRLAAEPEFPLPSTGMHHGSAVERNGDYFGSAVNLTSRLSAQAHAGQLLATSEIAAAARAQGVRVVELGDFALKNIADRVHLYDVHIGPRSDAIAVDPVCRMRVDIDKAAGRLSYEDTNYWFCSLDCIAKFLERHSIA